MDISELTLKILFLFFPGIICYFLVDSLVAHTERKPHAIFLLSFVYGVLAYVVYALVKALAIPLFGSKVENQQLTVPLPVVEISDSLLNKSSKLDAGEIAIVTGCAIVLAFLISVMINRKWLYGFAHKCGISKKFGDHDVWAYVFNSKEVQWATFRDLEHNLMFSGYVIAFSDTEKNAEIVLSDAIVYNERTAEELYRTDRIYLSRKKDNLTIELPLPTVT